MLTSITQIIFFSGVAVGLYTFIGYPIVAWIISRAFPKPVRRGVHEPLVSVIITAYNEEKAIRDKIENTLKIDYPPQKMEILVVSDHSTDATDLIVNEFVDRNVRLLRLDERKGKTAAQNLAVESSTGEVIIFSDATTMYEPDVLRQMLPNFADATVGCVAGKLIYVDKKDSSVGKSARRYWNYETFIKQAESGGCSMIGASGCLYAVRRSAYVPMYNEACSDFLIATVVYKQGLRTVFEPNAVCTEDTNVRVDKEMKMRVRVISQTINDLWKNREMLDPFRSGFFAVELFSHKVLRYAVPFVLAAMLVTSGILAFDSSVFFVVFLAQACFYGAAFLGLLLERAGFALGIFAIPSYFVLTNAASLFGFYHFLRGERFASWEPIREEYIESLSEPKNV